MMQLMEIINRAGAGGAVPGATNAAPHRNIHTDRYHLNVYNRLKLVADGTVEDVRMALRAIRAELNAGTFIF